MVQVGYTPRFGLYTSYITSGLRPSVYSVIMQGPATRCVSSLLAIPTVTKHRRVANMIMIGQDSTVRTGFIQMLSSAIVTCRNM